MKYSNANDILPNEIIKIIQEYINGEYLYIPKKVNSQRKWGEKNGSRELFDKRNSEIYFKYINGAKTVELSEEYFLSEKSIRRIVSLKRKNNST